MSYKSLLTVLTDLEGIERALGAAVAVAQQEDAHLDVLCVGVDRTQVGYYYEGAAVFAYQTTLDQARGAAQEILQAVRAYLGRQDIRWSAEGVVSQIGSLSQLVALRARFSDLVILPQPYRAERQQEAEIVLEAGLFEGQAPVLVLPEGELPLPIGRRIALAWNQSDESLSAARKALPFLRRADLVNITVIDPPAHGPERSDPGGALSQMLARQGVKAEVSVLAKTLPRISEVIARHARDIDADLVVMGAYGHSRFREAILGGATRNTLESAEIPVLMAR